MWKKSLLAAVAVMVLTLPVLVRALTEPRPRAQAPAGQSSSTAGQPTFEVASVKPLSPGDRTPRFGFQPGGRFVSTVQLQAAISFAYNLPFNLSPRLTGGPDWIRSMDTAYDIEATGVLPAGLSKKARLDRERSMVQALLADRFKLVIHRETRELPVYALVVAKGGPKLQKADIEEKDCPDPSATPTPDLRTVCGLVGGRGRGIHARAVSMSDLASGMENYTDRPLLDKTGLQGLYHIETTPWLPMQVGPPPAPGVKAEDGTYQTDLPTIFTVFEKLGLKMEPGKEKVDVYVIDSVEKPSAN
jgi:uncharacterized protein (TIGR03435 family)